MTLGERINKYRKRAGISQEELADRLSVTRQSISLWETDQTIPSLDNLITLAEIFNISMDELCGVGAKRTTEETKETVLEQPSSIEEQLAETVNENVLAYCETKVTEQILNKVGGMYIRKFVISCIIILAASLMMGLSIILNDMDPAFIFIPILLIVTIVAVMITVIVKSKKIKKESIKNNSDLMYCCKFYSTHIDVESKSKQSYSKFSINYSDIKRTVQDDNYFYVFLPNNRFLPIDRKYLNESINIVTGLLKMPVDSAEQHSPATSVKTRSSIRSFLIAMFVLSILSIFGAMITVGISFNLSPLPEFGAVMTEYMWIFFLFVPIPLASVILGIIFITKKYKCKKNIIAGVIMCVLLCIYGSFSFVFKGAVQHDDYCAKSLDAYLPFNVSDAKGYTCYEVGKFDGELYNGMIKVDDPSVVFGWISDNENDFKRDMLSYPSGMINAYYSILISDYDYYYLYDVTYSEANYIDLTDRTHYVLLAYNSQTKVLFMCDFIYPFNRA